MRASLFYLPTVGNREQIEQGRAGLCPELYQQMLHEVFGQARLGDELEYHSVSFTEHHFHIEGFELSNNPVLLDRWVFCWEWNSLIPDDALRRSIELFATQVVPKVGEKLEAPS